MLYIQIVFSAVGPDLLELSDFQVTHSIHFHVVDIQIGEYNENGVLIRANECGGKTYCTNPSWAQGKDYPNGKSGKISSTAPLKNTAFLPVGGYAVVYFKSDNPGYWFLHCHIQADILAGMAVIISEAEDEHFRVPSEIDNCGDFDWTIEEFYNALDAFPQSMEEVKDDDDDINDLALGLNVGLRSALLLSFILNVLLLILCCCIKHKTNKFHGA